MHLFVHRAHFRRIKPKLKREYIKEIIDGNSIIVLAQEEQEALNMAMEAEKPATK